MVTVRAVCSADSDVFHGLHPPVSADHSILSCREISADYLAPRLEIYYYQAGPIQWIVSLSYEGKIVLSLLGKSEDFYFTPGVVMRQAVASRCLAKLHQQFMTDFTDEQTLSALIPSDATVAFSYAVILLSLRTDPGDLALWARRTELVFWRSIHPFRPLGPIELADCLMGCSICH